MSIKLDLGKFKKIKADKHSTVMRHEDGHELTVAHSALSPKLRGQLAEIPFFDGGPAIADTSGYGDVKKPENKNGGSSGLPPSGSGKASQPNGDRADPNLDPFKAAAQKFNAERVNQYADGGDVAADDMAASMGAPTAKASFQDAPPPAAAPEDSTIADARQIYNLKVNGIGASPGTPVDPAMMQQTGMMFGPNGEAPQHFNEAAWDEATKAAQQQQQAAAAKAQQDAADVVQKNKSRAQAGVPLLPVPQTPAGQSGASNAIQQPSAQSGQASGLVSSQGGGADPYGTAATGDAYARGIQEQKSGIFGEANAMAAQGKAEAQALQATVERQQLQAKSYQDHYQALDQERQHFQSDLMNQHIDPQHYLNSQGTVQRIATSIGLILGGMGGGILGQENPALKMLNANIDRDIASQQAEMGKKENLLTANMKQFGNLRDATDMTRVMQNDIVSSQLKMAAAKAMDPLAKSRALQAAGRLDAESAPMLGQIAARKTLLSGLQNGSADPARVVNLIIPEHQRAAANKELAEAQEAVKARDNLVSAMDQVYKLNTVGNRSLHPVESRRQIAAIKGPIVAALSKATAGRFTEQDSQMLDSLFSGISPDPATLAIQKAQAVKLINEKMNFNILKTYGINPDNFGRYNSQGQSRIQESAPVPKR